MGYATYALDATFRWKIRTRGMNGRQTVHQQPQYGARNREF